jgi:hypothetical protein
VPPTDRKQSAWGDNKEKNVDKAEIPIGQVPPIPPAALRPVGLRSGKAGFAGPAARTGPTRHSGEPILAIDSNT